MLEKINYLTELETILEKYEKNLLKKDEFLQQKKQYFDNFLTMFSVQRPQSELRTLFDNIQNNFLFKTVIGYFNFCIIIASFGFLNIHKILKFFNPPPSPSIIQKNKGKTKSYISHVEMIHNLKLKYGSYHNSKRDSADLTEKEYQEIKKRILSREFVLNNPYTENEIRNKPTENKKPEAKKPHNKYHSPKKDPSDISILGKIAMLSFKVRTSESLELLANGQDLLSEALKIDYLLEQKYLSATEYIELDSYVTERLKEASPKLYYQELLGKRRVNKEYKKLLQKYPNYKGVLKE